jgi:hypothetical protein
MMGDEGMQLTEKPAQPKSTVPLHPWSAHWLTVTEFSRMMGRAPDTVHWWIRQGILTEFGIPVYRVRGGKLHSGRIFIKNIY